MAIHNDCVITINLNEFEMVDLVSPSWTIQVPRRKTK